MIHSLVIHNQQSSLLSNKLPFPSQRDSQPIQLHVVKAETSTVDKQDISVSIPKQINSASSRQMNSASPNVAKSEVKTQGSSPPLEKRAPTTAHVNISTTQLSSKYIICHT